MEKFLDRDSLSVVMKFVGPNYGKEELAFLDEIKNYKKAIYLDVNIGWSIYPSSGFYFDYQFVRDNRIITCGIYRRVIDGQINIQHIPYQTECNMPMNMTWEEFYENIKK